MKRDQWQMEEACINYTIINLHAENIRFAYVLRFFGKSIGAGAYIAKQSLDCNNHFTPQKYWTLNVHLNFVLVVP